MMGGYGSKINLMHMKEEKYGILFKRAMVSYSSSLVTGGKKALTSQSTARGEDGRIQRHPCPESRRLSNVECRGGEESWESVTGFIKHHWLHSGYRRMRFLWTCLSIQEESH